MRYLIWLCLSTITFSTFLFSQWKKETIITFNKTNRSNLEVLQISSKRACFNEGGIIIRS
jgi:hypothetical protein